MQNTKQKKIVFGEQPDSFSARSLKFGCDEVVDSLSDESVQEDVQELLNNQSARFYVRKKPWFIIPFDSACLSYFKGGLFFLTLPNVCFNVFVVAFGAHYSIYHVVLYMDIIYGLDILFNFITSYSDKESFVQEYSLRKIAFNYLRYGTFVMDAIATMPFSLLGNDPDYVQDILILKLLRIIKISNDDALEKQIVLLMNLSLTNDMSRSERINQAIRTRAFSRIFKLFSMSLIGIYLSGCLWYRFSSSWQAAFIPNDPSSYYFVNRFGQFDIDENLSSVAKIIVTLMYFMLTTLSTVGFGDFYPSSIMEKIMGIFIEVVGVSIFAILMNEFIDAVIQKENSSETDKELMLANWFAIIKHIRN